MLAFAPALASPLGWHPPWLAEWDRNGHDARSSPIDRLYISTVRSGGRGAAAWRRGIESRMAHRIVAFAGSSLVTSGSENLNVQSLEHFIKENPDSLGNVAQDILRGNLTRDIRHRAETAPSPAPMQIHPYPLEVPVSLVRRASTDNRLHPCKYLAADIPRASVSSASLVRDYRCPRCSRKRPCRCHRWSPKSAMPLPAAFRKVGYLAELSLPSMGELQ